MEQLSADVNSKLKIDTLYCTKFERWCDVYLKIDNHIDVLNCEADQKTFATIHDFYINTQFSQLVTLVFRKKKDEDNDDEDNDDEDNDDEDNDEEDSENSDNYYEEDNDEDSENSDNEYEEDNDEVEIIENIVETKYDYIILVLQENNLGNFVVCNQYTILPDFHLYTIISHPDYDSQYMTNIKNPLIRNLSIIQKRNIRLLNKIFEDYTATNSPLDIDFILSLERKTYDIKMLGTDIIDAQILLDKNPHELRKLCRTNIYIRKIVDTQHFIKMYLEMYFPYMSSEWDNSDRDLKSKSEIEFQERYEEVYELFPSMKVTVNDVISELPSKHGVSMSYIAYLVMIYDIFFYNKYIYSDEYIQFYKMEETNILHIDNLRMKNMKRKRQDKVNGYQELLSLPGKHRNIDINELYSGEYGFRSVYTKYRRFFSKCEDPKINEHDQLDKLSLVKMILISSIGRTVLYGKVTSISGFILKDIDMRQFILIGNVNMVKYLHHFEFYRVDAFMGRYNDVYDAIFEGRNIKMYKFCLHQFHIDITQIGIRELINGGVEFIKYFKRKFNINFGTDPDLLPSEDNILRKKDFELVKYCYENEIFPKWITSPQRFLRRLLILEYDMDCISYFEKVTGVVCLPTKKIIFSELPGKNVDFYRKFLPIECHTSVQQLITNGELIQDTNSNITSSNDELTQDIDSNITSSNNVSFGTTSLSTYHVTIIHDKDKTKSKIVFYMEGKIILEINFYDFIMSQTGNFFIDNHILKLIVEEWKCISYFNFPLLFRIIETNSVTLKYILKNQELKDILNRGTDGGLWQMDSSSMDFWTDYRKHYKVNLLLVELMKQYYVKIN